MVSAESVVAAMLAAVFVAAAIGKLRNRPRSVDAVRDFGVPASLSAPVALALPFVELAVAVGLLLSVTRRGAAFAAAGLLTAFTGAIAANLLRGRRPACNCFGQSTAKPIGSASLLRNGVLIAAAFVVVSGVGRDVTLGADAPTASTLTGLAIAFCLLAVAGQGWLLLGLLRQNGRLLMRVEALEGGTVSAGHVAHADRGHDHVPDEVVLGLPMRATAPTFEAESVDNGPVSLDELLAPGRPALLLFVDPKCGPCESLLPDVQRWQEELRESLRIVVLTQGDLKAGRDKARANGLVDVLLDPEHMIAESYQYAGTPGAVVVTPEGKIGSAVAAGPQRIRALVQSLAPRAAVTLPPFALPTLDGDTVTDADVRNTALVFWDPGCGFCQKMLPELRAWEAEHGDGSLVLVSRGDVEANRALGVRSRVLLDQDGVLSRTLGSGGTPTAFRVDSSGTIVGDMAIGAAEVLRLAAAASVAG